ncbi:hypothetical protein [Vibrio jasicida]|uniref:hypothetical protein n=1 Tax=Vibrio jasicida TaxID=766224 RepID=UPI0005ED809D|nr:hypothetical protein [Vibrio jasicida]
MNSFNFQPETLPSEYYYATPWRTTVLDARLETRLLLRSSTPLTLPQSLTGADINRLRQQGVILSNEFRTIAR